jgi:hypothetical protein|nr:MAG TPA: holin family protein [Bacteriophage sp.]
MPTEVISNIYLNYGLVGLVIIGFAILVVYVIRSSKEREDKLHAIINKLSDELPSIRETVERIERKILE